MARITPDNRVIDTTLIHMSLADCSQFITVCNLLFLMIIKVQNNNYGRSYSLHIYDGEKKISVKKSERGHYSNIFST